jgi:hypothetical protein
MASLLQPPPAPPERFASPQPVGTWRASWAFAWRYPRWNVSRHAASFRAADAFVVSIQKSGRTWVRVFLTAYFSEWGKQNFSPAARPAAASALPALCYTHDLWEHKAKERFGERLRGKWLIPREECLHKPILLVVRDPRDQMVSLFFHLKKRTGTFKGDLPALLRDPVFGAERVVNIMNRWLAEWVGHSRLHVLRYEDARHDPETIFAAALRFLLPTLALDPLALSRAVEISSFENMRRLEAGTKDAQGTELVADLNTEALRPKDAADPDSYKVRRGKVGGYADYLAAPDIAYLNGILAKLDPRYGYGPGELITPAK